MLFGFRKLFKSGCFSGGAFGFSISYGWNVLKNWSL